MSVLDRYAQGATPLTSRALPAPGPLAGASIGAFSGYGELHPVRRQLVLEFVEPRPWFAEHVESALNGLLALEPRWDGHHAKPVSEEAVKPCVHVIWNLMGDQVPPPQLFPLPDGGVQVEWHIAHNDIEIEIDAGGEPHALATRNTGETVAEGVVGSDDLPSVEPIRAFLAEISEALYAR